MSESGVETSSSLLQRLEEYEKAVEKIQKEFLNNVNTRLLSNEITNKSLMKAIIQISIIDENKWLDQKDDAQLFQNIFSSLSKFVPLFAETSKEIPAQIELLDGILDSFTSNCETYVVKKDKRVRRIPKLIQCLYDFEILSSSAIMDWYESEISKQEDQMSEEVRQVHEDFMKQIKSFIAWLESPSDDDEDED